MGYLVKATSINVARALYSVNWFDIAPGLPLIGKGLGLSVVQLGIATTFFYIGLAPFQLIGGIFAARIGSRKIAFIGLLILGLGAILSGLSKNLVELSSARFLAGCGSAFFFSPGLSILRDVTPPESYGLQVGIYNGAFSLGGGIGVLGWVIVDNVLGWQNGLILGGILVIAVSIENFLVLRGIKEKLTETTELKQKLLSIVRNKFLWLLSVGTIGAMFVETDMGQLLVYFAENYLRISPSGSGLLDGLFLAIGFPGGLVGGHFISKSKARIPFTYAALFLSSLSFVLIPFSRNFLLLVFLGGMAGFFVVTGFSALYLFSVKHIPDKSMVPFGLAFVNFISLAIGSSSPFFFTLLTDRIGPDYGWIVLGTIGIVLIPLILLAKPLDSS